MTTCPIQDRVVRSRQKIVFGAEPSSAQYWRDIWSYRYLAYNLAWRDIAVRYKQTVLGMLWAIIRPLSTMLIFTLVFSLFARIRIETVPYAIMVLSGLICYQLVSTVLNAASMSVIGNSNLIAKIYFPRLLVPIGTVLSALADFAVALLIMFVLMACFGIVPTWRVVLLPIFFVISLLMAFGAGLWFAAIAVRYRDVLHIVPFLLQLAIYLSPVGYPRSIVPQWAQVGYALNPLVGVIDGFRWSLLGAEAFPLDPLATWVSTVTAMVLVWTGVVYFRRVEHLFADSL